MKTILTKKEKITKREVSGDENVKRPIIYLRYFKGELIYIGESYSYESSRHLRFEEGNPYDYVRCLNANADTDFRRKWEAKLIVRLKPKIQKLDHYWRKAKLDYTCSTDGAIIRRKNTDRVLLFVSKKYKKLCNLYEKFLSYDVKHVQGMNLWEKEQEPSKKELLSNAAEYMAKEDNYLNRFDMAETFAQDAWIVLESIKMISELPVGVLNTQVKYYIDHVDRTVKKMYKILHSLLKARGIEIPPSTRGVGERLNRNLHPSMKNMYNDKILGLKHLYGVTSLLENKS